METNSKTQRRRYLIFNLFFVFVLLAFLFSVFSVYTKKSDSEPAKKFFETEKINYENAVYNYFEEEKGLFSVEYKNNYELLTKEKVWFLSELKTGNIVFQLFEKTPEMEFDPKKFECTVVAEKEFCFTKNTPKFIYKNLQFNKQIHDPIKYEFYTRAKALSDLLKLKFPSTDFSVYADNCFYDVKKAHPFSGEICFAKSNSIVTGISGSFYPESGVNLGGILKYLFTIFDLNKFYYNTEKLDMSQFELMTIYNGFFPIIAEGIFQGIIQNPDSAQIWPNRVIYKSEANKIISNFFEYKNGKQLRDYESTDNFRIDTTIFVNKNSPLKLKEELEISNSKKNEIKNTKEITKIIQEEGNLKVYRQIAPGLFKSVFSIKNIENKDIKNTFLKFEDNNPEKLEGDFLIGLTDNSFRHFEFKIKEDSFLGLEKYNKTIIEDPNLLPNNVPVTKIFSKKVADIDIYLEPEDFKSLIINRTRPTRYRALVDIAFPDGKSLKKPALIKTRGNAGRGYLKSSYTLEFFEDLKENFEFEGDEFLEGADELILRSHISDESRIKEKLIYKAFEFLGYVSPKFFESTLTINGMDLGFYQVSEDIKNEFFKQRKVDTISFIKTKNKSGDMYANLSYNLNDKATLALYEYKNKEDEELLLNLIKALDLNDPELIAEIDDKNVFDYAMLAYIGTANDSLAYNYCLYKDKKDNKWRMFFFDADSAFNYAPNISRKKVFEFMAKDEGIYNNLIKYVYENLSEKKRKEYYYDFLKRWNKNVDLISLIDMYIKEYEPFFNLDKSLWNKRFLEEKDHEINIMAKIEQTRKVLIEINKNIRLEF